MRRSPLRRARPLALPSRTCSSAGRALLLLALALAPLVVPAAAAAQRVAVARFSGSRASSLRPQLIRSLRDGGLDTIAERDQREAAMNAGVGFPISEVDIPTVAPLLGADRFIYADVNRVAGRWTVIIKVFDAAGNELGGHTFDESSAGALSRPVREEAFARLRAFLTSDAPAAASDPGTTQPPSDEPPPDPSSPGGSSAWYDQGANAEPADDAPEEEAEEEDEPRQRGPRRDAIRVQLNGGTLHRDFVADTLVVAYLRPPFPDAELVPLAEEHSYHSGGAGHFELGGRVELFPGAFFSRGIPADFGLMVEVSGGLGMSASGPACTDDATLEPGSSSQRRNRCGDNESDTIDVGPSQMAWYVGAVFDHLFRSPRLGLRLDLGYGTFTWDLDVDALTRLQRDAIVPPMQYSYVNIGAAVRYYFTRELGVQIRGAYMHGLDIGQDAKDIWGQDTSGAFLGWRAGGDIIVDLTSQGVPGVYATIGGEVFQYLTNFSGQPACSDGTDTCDEYDLWEPWPVGSSETDPRGTVASNAGITDTVSDFYWRLQFSVGYAFRPR